MRIAVSQPNYVPWIGYFQIINSVDTFVFLDDVQYTPRDWRNRNRIKTTKGLEWLSVGVNLPFGRLTPINRAEIDDETWTNRHLNGLRHAYSRSPNFRSIYPQIETWIMAKSNETFISQLDINLTIEIARFLGIQTEFKTASEISIIGEKSERLLGICQQLNASQYVSGPSARSYLNVDIFEESGISVDFYDYKVKEYEQLNGEFAGQVSVLDPLLNLGHEAKDLL